MHHLFDIYKIDGAILLGGLRLIRVAICDSDMAFCCVIRDILYDIFREQKCFVEDYANGAELMRDMKEGKLFQVIILEVDLPILNGITLGRLIRQYTYGQDISIVYISYRRCGAEEVANIRPCGYIFKSQSIQKIKIEIEACVKDFHIPGRLVERRQKRILFFDPTKILYLESINRTTIVHESDVGERRLSTCLRDIYADLILIDSYFLQCHKSFVINARKITAYARNELELDLEWRVPVSHGYRQGLKDAYLQLFDTNLSKMK